MLQRKSPPDDAARGALVRNAVAVAAPRAEVCMRCGLMRVPHSSIVIVCPEEGLAVEAPICGNCTRRMSR